MKLDLDRSAFIAIDVQNDFCPGGALAVKDGADIIPLVNKLAAFFKYSIATQDWHPQAHVSFASSHPGASAYSSIIINRQENVVWPDHCVQGSRGADFHPSLRMEPYRLIIRKGTNLALDSYSAFFENDGKTATGLDGYLKGLGINTVVLAGLAFDYCVFFSARDAARLGYKTLVVEDASKPVGSPPGSVEEAVKDMQSRAVAIIKSGDILS